MSDNKFIKHLRGEDTVKSVLEIKNQRTTTSFANMPDGDTSNANDVYSDHRGNATGVLKGTENWKLDGQNLVETTTVYGDGRDFTDSFSVFSNGLWVDASCTFATPKLFAANTKFVLKLCGHDLETVVNHTVDFTLIVKFGTSNLISKTFTVTEQAFDFCKEFVIDFAESNSSTIKADAGSIMQVQLLCADPAAQAVLYNGMTVFTALQRRVDGDAVASDKKTFDEVVQDIDDINEEIDQIHEDIDDLEDYVDDTFVRLDGNSIMTGPLKMRASISFECAIAPYWHGVGFYKLNDDNSVTLLASMEADDGFCPYGTNKYNIGSNYHKWKNLYLAGKAYVSVINNGYDISVPVTNSADTFALVTKDINPLQQQINHLQTIGRFLSFWDATTGLAQTNPQTSPYVYQTGDYFRVGVVAGPGGTNYKPSGPSYTIGVASTTVETERLSVGQVYYYDGANWALAAGGSVAIDETTIIFNNNDEIQAVAVVDQNTGIVKTWTGTAAEYDAIVTKDPDTEYIIIDDIGTPTPIKKDVSERNIGELVYSLVPIADSGLHLLDGNLLDGTGIYADFYNYMVGIQSTASQIFCSESDWQTSVLTYGVCGKFVLDTTNSTIRLPKITGFIEGTITASELGALVEAGLPNIIAGLSMGDRGANISGSGAAQAHSFGTSKFTNQSSTASTYDGWDIDASRSSAVYGNSNTVQPQSVKGYIYIVVANTAKTPVQVDIDNIVTDLNDKVNKGHEVIEFQAPTAENNYTWYRKYADGWVEQGGCYSQNIGTGDTAWSATLPVPMSDNNYTASVNINGGYSGNTTIQCEGNTSTVVKGYGRSPSGAGSKKIMWRVEGMAA